MKKYFVIAEILVLFILSLSACIAEEPISTEPAFTPTLTSLPIFTPSPVPTNTSTLVPTEEPIKNTPTASPTPDPGLIITLGEDVSAPWYPCESVFSPDGQTVALVCNRIRFWDTNTFELVYELENPYPENCYLENPIYNDTGEYFAVSVTGCWEETGLFSSGHVLVWDINTRTLIHDWVQEYPLVENQFPIPLSALIFIPNTTKLAYASGNTIIISDLKDVDSNPEILNLGNEMYATEISIGDDLEFLYILKSVTYFRVQDYEIQSWHLNPNYLDFDRVFSEIWPNDVIMYLHNDNLLQEFTKEDRFEIWNFTTNEVSPYPEPIEWFYINSDFSYLVTVYLADNGNDKIFELWDAQTQEVLYSFQPSFGKKWYPNNMMSFSSDNTMLAIAHNEQLTLWNINAIVNPESKP